MCCLGGTAMHEPGKHETTRFCLEGESARPTISKFIASLE